MFWHVLTLIGGLIILGVGGDLLVRGAAALARSLGISALVVGLTIVAFGTSAPELAVSVVACLNGQDALAIGNVVGSNIANTLLVLGLAALIRPIAISLNIIRLDAPIMLAVSILLAVFAFQTGRLVFWQGAVFVAGLIGYLVLTCRVSGRESEEVRQEFNKTVPGNGARVLYVVFILLGLAGLKYGAEFIVSGASEIAKVLGVSDRIIGLTIVAVGTSLPEIATTIVAARRGQPDIAIGNIVGSNIFNILSVLGIAALVSSPVAIDATAVMRDIPIMVGTAALSMPLMWTGRRVSRAEGTALLALYFGYLGLTVGVR
ncbi:MAG: calcium/sodium antiporter [Phycisphaerae bacterium]|nr:calcium/sodium antiporter [Phycisphaerae bacterium]